MTHPPPSALDAGRGGLDRRTGFARDGGSSRQIRASQEDGDDGDRNRDGRELPGKLARLIVGLRLTAAEAEGAESLGRNTDRLRLRLRRWARREANWQRGFQFAPAGSAAARA